MAGLAVVALSTVACKRSTPNDVQDGSTSTTQDTSSKSDSPKQPTDSAIPPAPGGTRPTTTTTATKLSIAHVERLQRSFNPSSGEDVTIRFSVSVPANVTLTVHGPNRELVARVLDAKSCRTGLTTVTWNGRDVDGQIVPDEAYFFRIEAIAGDRSDLWDPSVLGGGERMTAGHLTTLSGNRFSYELPSAGRVLVRAAVIDGPLLKTLVNWSPRTAGACIETWNGMDEDNLRDLSTLSRLRLAVMAFALPDKTVIATGNTSEAYRAYYARVGHKRPRLDTNVRTRQGDSVLSPHWRIPPHLNRDPGLTMSIATKGVAATPSDTNDKTNEAANVLALTSSESPYLVRVDIPDPQEKAFMNDQRFEMIIYVDDRRVLEVEQGHVPFTYPWDISSLSPGRHVFTVNVASFRNHVGTVSRLVDVSP